MLKNDLTELVFILDRSGSMQGLEADVIGGFNSLLEKQKGEPGRAFVSTVLFDNRSEVLHDRVPLQAVPPMTRAQYSVRGCTALLDAVGGAIHHIGNIHKYARAEDVPARTLFVITTDGMENASSRYRLDQVRERIRRQKERYGWEFLFLGANIDALQAAGTLGISGDRAANFHGDSAGVRLSYEAVDQVVCSIRCGAPAAPGWKEALDRDFRTRPAGRR